MYTCMQTIYEPRCEKTGFLHIRKTKMQISFVVTAKLISAFVFATWIAQSLTWSETPKTGFLTTRLILSLVKVAEWQTFWKELLTRLVIHGTFVYLYM